MQYIATRPRVERHGEHGLFSNRPISLDASLKEIEAHPGNVWTFIWSLRRENAARLGYDHAGSWQKLIKAHQAEIAEAMKIPPDQCASGKLYLVGDEVMQDKERTTYWLAQSATQGNQYAQFPLFDCKYKSTAFPLDKTIFPWYKKLYFSY